MRRRTTLFWGRGPKREELEELKREGRHHSPFFSLSINKERMRKQARLKGEVRRDSTEVTKERMPFLRLDHKPHPISNQGRQGSTV